MHNIRLTASHVYLRDSHELKNAVIGKLDGDGKHAADEKFTLTISWGDGTPPDTRHSGAHEIHGSHRYETAGRYLFEIEVRDRCGCSARARAHVHIGSLSERRAAQAYRRIVGANPAQTEVVKLAALDSTALLGAILETPGYRAAKVDAVYRQYLRRAPTADEATHASATLASGGASALRAAVLSSPQYFAERGGNTRNGFLSRLFLDANERLPTAAEDGRLPQDLSNSSARQSIAADVLSTNEASVSLFQTLHRTQFKKAPSPQDLAQAAHPDPKDRTTDYAIPILGKVIEMLDLPILYTDHVNPAFDTSNPEWPAPVVGGVTLLSNPPGYDGDREWIPVLEPRDAEPEPQPVAIAGVALDPHNSDQDLPFTHLFSRDWNFLIAPDDNSLMAAGNLDYRKDPAQIFKTDQDVADAVDAAAKLGIGTVGVVEVETEQGTIPVDWYRVQEGERVVVYGRWIIDAGHDTYSTEIHPPLLLVRARSTDGADIAGPDVTRLTIWSRPFLCSQLFGFIGYDQPAGLRTQITRELTRIGTGGAYIAAGVAPVEDPKYQDLYVDLRSALRKPFSGQQNLDFVVRPKNKRSAPTDTLMVAFGFQVRPGVKVFVDDVDGEWGAVTLRVQMDEATYSMPDDQLLLAGPRVVTVKDIVSQLSADEAQKIQDGLAAQIAQARQDHGNAVADRIQLALDQAGAIMNVYQLPLPSGEPWSNFSNQPGAPATSVLGILPTTVNTGYNNTQPFPILGWFNVWWQHA